MKIKAIKFRYAIEYDELILIPSSKQLNPLYSLTAK